MMRLSAHLTQLSGPMLLMGVPSLLPLNVGMMLVLWLSLTVHSLISALRTNQ